MQRLLSNPRPMSGVCKRCLWLLFIAIGAFGTAGAGLQWTVYTHENMRFQVLTISDFAVDKSGELWAAGIKGVGSVPISPCALY